MGNQKAEAETKKDFNVNEYLDRELLRFTTAGSVDDGKSTLIGRLLYDSKAIFQDQMDQLKAASALRGEENVNLALLTDGLRAEREQGITIDVAYRYFSTPKRKFIIADTPGHEQYTRNMVTGASTANLAIILIDARNGVLPQSKRHGIIASLLGIPHVIVAVNKMDLVDYSQDVYNDIITEYADFAKKLDIHDMNFIPVSALRGDNIVYKSSDMPWYDGSTVLHYLEHVTISSDRNLVDFRFPVQYVVRPHQNFRGFAGRIASGSITTGQQIAALPSGIQSRVKEIHSPDGPVSEAFESQSVILTLEDEIDISRGDMIVRKNNIPHIGARFDATICWMDDKRPLSTTNSYDLQHTTRHTQAYVRKLHYNINVNTLHREQNETLTLNEIGRVEIETTQPVFCDPYDNNHTTGSFILIDAATNLTVAAGMIRGKIMTADDIHHNEVEGRPSPNIVWDAGSISRADREKRIGQKAYCLWFTGLSGSGKSTIARELERRLYDEGKQVSVLDGDNVRHGLNADLGFSTEDRKENIRRIAHVARLMFESGIIVICTFISPSRELRDYARSLFPEGRFKEVHVKCDIEECKNRDPKGLYKKAVRGEIAEFTGITSPYEEPHTPDLVIDTRAHTIFECTDKAESILD